MMSLRNTGNIENEKTLRFFKDEGKEKSLYQIPKAADHDALGQGSVDYFKALAEASGIPYQTLINLYLRGCAANERKLDLKWR